MEAASAPTVLPARVKPRGRRSTLLAGVLAWVFPGLGQIYVGRGDKALAMLLGVGGLYFWGLSLTGFTCVNPSTYALEFVAHVFAGGPTALTLHLTEGFEVTRWYPHFEEGRLFVAVAGLLNIVAISDAVTSAAMRNARAWATTGRLAEADEQAEHAEQAEQASAPPGPPLAAPTWVPPVGLLEALRATGPDDGEPDGSAEAGATPAERPTTSQSEGD